ncbi:uncharacterized [Tachysurus ichikawai]
MSHPLWFQLYVISHFLLANSGRHPLTMTVLVPLWVIMQMLAAGCMSQDDTLQPGDKGMKWRGIKTGLNSTINPIQFYRQTQFRFAHHFLHLFKNSCFMAN